ncbi:hypothetical protein Tco_0973440 [Tanacetum coccineum]
MRKYKVGLNVTKDHSYYSIAVIVSSSDEKPTNHAKKSPSKSYILLRNVHQNVIVAVNIFMARSSGNIVNTSFYRKIIETIHVDFDELTAMASEQLGSGPGLQLMTPATYSQGLVTNPIPHQPCNPPPRYDWDRLFQPMFDEYFNPPTIVVSLVPVAATPRAVDLAESPVSTSIDQDALSTSIP